MSPSTGTLIWVSCRPLIRLAAGIASGFIITRADIFPPVAARGAGQIALRITLPCLLFSKIITAFTSDNIKALGPLVLVAVLYEAIGVALAWVIKQFFWVPHRLRYGILIAGGWANVGDLATAVILSITQNPPFRGAADQNLAVAYISVFILVFSITLFPCGFHRWIAWDFMGPDVEPEIVQARIKARRQWLLRFLLLNKRQGGALHDNEKVTSRDAELATTPESQQSTSNRRASIKDDVTTLLTHPSESADPPSKSSHDATTQIEATVAAQVSPSRWSVSRLNANAGNFIKGLFNPISVSIYIALPISLVPKLKALFIDVPGVDMPPAPDGQPPLSFIQDIATFIGAASIPIGLICVGSSLARLNVPLSHWRKLPIGAILWLAIVRILILPVLGVLICQGLIHAGLLSKDDKVLLFVCMFLSCLPTATTQVYLTQVHSGTGTAEDIAAFLIPQYILMFISMTVLNAYAIHTIF